ncbi:MAG: hypothetical protein R6V10_15445 [bacterium]
MSKSMKSKDSDFQELVREYFSGDRGQKLGLAAFTVWVSLLVHSMPSSGLVSVSHKTMLDWTGITSRSTLRRALHELTDKGYLVRLELEEARNLPRVYRVGAPPKPAMKLPDVVPRHLDIDLIMKDLGLDPKGSS